MITHHVAWLAQTSTASPSQWEGKTATGLEVYVRYRHHGLYIRIGAIQIGANLGPELTLRMEHVQTSDKYGDAMTLEELKELTSGLIAWPK